MKKYVEFKLAKQKPKTNVYSVLSKAYGDILGIIKWYPNWRQYCFFPEDATVWSKGCLEEINDFIEEIMEKRKHDQKTTV